MEKNVTSDFFFQGFFSHPGSARPLLVDLIVITVHLCTPVQVTVTELQQEACECRAAGHLMASPRSSSCVLLLP